MLPYMGKKKKKKSTELTAQCREGMAGAAIKGRQKWDRSVPGQAVQAGAGAAGTGWGREAATSHQHANQERCSRIKTHHAPRSLERTQKRFSDDLTL